jgi:cobalamin biosynthesis protein CobD/CbiB
MHFGFYGIPSLGFFTKGCPHTNGITRVSRAVCAGVFMLGLVLMGAAIMIYLLPRFFATLAAIVLFALGLGCLGIGFKVLLFQRQLNKIDSDSSDSCRKNVQIRVGEDFDAQSDDIVI